MIRFGSNDHSASQIWCKLNAMEGTRSIGEQEVSVCGRIVQQALMTDDHHEEYGKDARKENCYAFDRCFVISDATVPWRVAHADRNVS